MSEELKPCPFCGSTNISTDLVGEIECRQCFASGPCSEDEWTAWNTRTPDPRIARLEKALRELQGYAGRVYDIVADDCLEALAEPETDAEGRILNDGATLLDGLHDALDRARAALSEEGKA